MAAGAAVLFQQLPGAYHPSKSGGRGKRALAEFGTSCSGSRFLNGTTRLHLELEEKLAAFVGKKYALVFTTGFQANQGVVASLIGRTGYLILDELDHASILEGSRLSFGKVRKCAHNDMQDLEEVLKDLPYETPKMIVVDDAHGLGVIGAEGRGTASYFGLTGEVDVIMGTFSKSLASIGGFVAGRHEVIDYLRHQARSLFFTASIPATAAAAAIAALEVLQQEPGRMKQLWENTRYLIQGIRNIGFDTGGSKTPIIPIFIRDNELTFRFNQRLFEEGIFTSPVVSPAVPGNASLIRMSVLATHTRELLDKVLGKLEQIAGELEVFATVEQSLQTMDQRS